MQELTKKELKSDLFFLRVLNLREKNLLNEILKSRRIGFSTLNQDVHGTIILVKMNYVFVVLK